MKTFKLKFLCMVLAASNLSASNDSSFYKKRFSFEMGLSSIYCLDAQNPTLRKPVYYMRDAYTNVGFAKKWIPSYFNMGYSKGKRYFGFNFNYLASPDHENKPKNYGDVSERYYYIFNLVYGKVFYNSKLKFIFTPKLNLAYRTGYDWGFFGSYSSSRPHSFDLQFKYNAPGLGTGIGINKLILNILTIGMDINYTHYFEPKPDLNSYYGKYQEQLKSYKKNRNAFTYSLNLGVLIFSK